MWNYQGFLALFRGATPTIYRTFSQMFIYDALKALRRELYWSQGYSLSTTEHLLARVIAHVVTYPLELCKLRMMLDRRQKYE